VIDRRLHFKAINPALAILNNLPPEAHPGKPLHEILGSVFTKVQPSLEHVFTSGQPLLNVPLSGKLPTRPDPVQLLQNFFPLVDSRGRVVEVGAFVIETKSSPTLQGSFEHVAQPSNVGRQHDNNRTPHLDTMNHSEDASALHTSIILSGREQEVLRLLAIGKSNKEISLALSISVKTVETYRSRVMLKIRAPSLIHLVHYAIRHQIVTPQG
jgi:DNA-binding CsgD family transcriptional regulator